MLRRWRDSDLKPFAAMNADSRVMEYFPNTLPANEDDVGTESTITTSNETNWDDSFTKRRFRSSEASCGPYAQPPRFVSSGTPSGIKKNAPKRRSRAFLNGQSLVKNALRYEFVGCIGILRDDFPRRILRVAAKQR